MSTQRFLIVTDSIDQTHECNELEGMDLEYRVGDGGELIIEYFPVGMIEREHGTARISGPAVKHLTTTFSALDWSKVAWGSRGVADLEVVG